MRVQKNPLSNFLTPFVFCAQASFPGEVNSWHGQASTFHPPVFVCLLPTQFSRHAPCALAVRPTAKRKAVPAPSLLLGTWWFKSCWGAKPEQCTEQRGHALGGLGESCRDPRTGSIGPTPRKVEETLEKVCNLSDDRRVSSDAKASRPLCSDRGLCKRWVLGGGGTVSACYRARV